MNTLITISYDGTNYCGWQIQPGVLTVQGQIEAALLKTYGRKIGVQGASRTDAGVHARAQRALFNLEQEDFNIPLNKIPFALNTRLPSDIRILGAEEVPPTFDPISDAKQKTYEYRIYNGVFHDPLLRLYSEHIYLPLDFSKMKLAADYFLGEHDFASFRAVGGHAKTTVRTIYSIKLFNNNNLITMEIIGNGFLYNMVRIIAGTLVYVGLGKIKPHDIPGIIESKDRTKSGKTLNARGLTLIEVVYRTDLITNG